MIGICGVILNFFFNVLVLGDEGVLVFLFDDFGVEEEFDVLNCEGDVGDWLCSWLCFFYGLREVGLDEIGGLLMGFLIGGLVGGFLFCKLFVDVVCDEGVLLFMVLLGYGGKEIVWGFGGWVCVGVFLGFVELF